MTLLAFCCASSHGSQNHMVLKIMSCQQAQLTPSSKHELPVRSNPFKLKLTGFSCFLENIAQPPPPLSCLLQTVHLGGPQISCPKFPQPTNSARSCFPEYGRCCSESYLVLGMSLSLLRTCLSNLSFLSSSISVKRVLHPGSWGGA